MPLEFFDDAISLSGITGSKLKSEIIGAYYPFWWNITSGGELHNHEWPTAIIELDAATGEIYIEDTQEKILGSAGHAIALKFNEGNKQTLKIILVEKDISCYSHLKNVITKRWPAINILEAEGALKNNKSNIYLLNTELDTALGLISQLSLGNSLFFFDPLRSVSFKTIEKVSKPRIRNYFQTGTELIVFVFTSDWFLGRADFAGLPTVPDEKFWSESENKTVSEADELFGNTEWRLAILNNKPISERENTFIELYKKSLHKWFRYVLPMPFNPKDKQIYHLILCSNYEAGVQATRRFFCEKANNSYYKPDANKAYALFKVKYPELLNGLRGNQRPKQWKILWKIITVHEEGICDSRCNDFIDVEPDEKQRDKLLEWLAFEGYLNRLNSVNPWNLPITQFIINWNVVGRALGVVSPDPLQALSLKPLSIQEINK
ncbi:MAG TPA: three-Cys-motif partner protein TcmP [Dehalococcoidales bacterium]